MRRAALASVPVVHRATCVAVGLCGRLPYAIPVSTATGALTWSRGGMTSSQRGHRSGFAMYRPSVLGLVAVASVKTSCSALVLARHLVVQPVDPSEWVSSIELTCIGGSGGSGAVRFDPSRRRVSICWVVVLV